MNTQTSFLESLKQRLSINRNNLGSDLIAGLTLGISSIPDSMASAILAGVNPLAGLYAMIVGTPLGALFTSSARMHISTTSAMSLAVGSALILIPGGAEEKLQAVFMLAVLVGVFQIALGALKLGSLVRFVPYSVMTGFLNGVAVLIILGQLQDLTGYDSSFANRVAQALDLMLHLGDVIPQITFVGGVTIVLILVFDRIKPLRKFSLVLAMAIASALVPLFGLDLVPLVGDVTDIPNSLPRPLLPDFSLILPLIVPAISVGIIGLVQGAGISQGYPNPDGKFPDPSGDFLGQGVANLASGFFQGMPVGGSLSGTALAVSAGAKSRWANVFVGIIIAVIILVFADLVKLLAMPALAGLLIVVGFQTIKPQTIQSVWQTGLVPRAVMVITFIGTMIMPLQFAVLMGVAISIILFIGQQANRIRLVELVPVEGGLPIERPAPATLPSDRITILFPYGSLFYAAAKTLEDDLPKAENSKRAVVIFMLRGYDEFGSTLLGVLQRYAEQLQANGGMIMLAGISQGVYDQLVRTGVIEIISPENVFMEQAQWGVAANQAVEAAQAWLVETDHPKRPSQEE